MWVVHMVCISRFTYTWVHMCKLHLTWVHLYDSVCKYTCGYMHVETQIWNLAFSLLNPHFIYWCGFIQLNLELTNKASLASQFARETSSSASKAPDLQVHSHAHPTFPQVQGIPTLSSHCWECFNCRAMSSTLGNVLRLQFSHSFYLPILYERMVSK